MRGIVQVPVIGHPKDLAVCLEMFPHLLYISEIMFHIEAEYILPVEIRLTPPSDSGILGLLEEVIYLPQAGHLAFDGAL